ncbi:MAG: penicillin-binding protein 2 [Pseudomonadota bacterium]
MTPRFNAPSSKPLRTPCGIELHRVKPEFMTLDGNQKVALEMGKTRLLVAGIVFALAFMVIGGRLIDLAVTDRGNEPKIAGEATSPHLQTGRADIVDRNGVVLATTLPTASLYANPKHLKDPEAAARQLAEVLPELERAELKQKLSSSNSFVWVKRKLTPKQQYSVNRLGIPGLYFQREFKRFYPHGNLFPHTVGFAGMDNVGFSGIESAFDDLLRGGNQPLKLSLDIRFQHALAQELAAAMADFSAIGAAGIILDARNGEILALSSLPNFDPNKPAKADDEHRFNRATLGIYEMGSVFKIFTTAMALDKGYVTLNDGYDTREPIRAARFTIRDYKPKDRWLSIPEIFMYSSNIGTVHMAMEAGTDVQRSFLRDLGLLRSASIEINEVGRPILPSPWREINTMTISYGHGLAVSPLHVANAVAAIINGGVKQPTTLLKLNEGERPLGRRVISEATSFKMRQLMRLVVTDGTGSNADAPGYQIGGKTGTADKLINGRYARDRRIASFVAGFPMDDPRYVIFAMVDEPKGKKETFGYATGGWVAAPVIRRVVERLGPLLGMEPAAGGDDASQQLLLRAQAQAERHQIAAN